MGNPKSRIHNDKRTEAEQAQHRSEDLFRTLIENASDIVTILDAEGIICYESPAIERVLGYRQAELIGAKITGLTHPEDVPKVEEAIKAAASHRRTHGIARVVEARLRHKDGSWRVLESIGNRLPGPRPVAGIVIHSRDITERMRAEEALLESNERFRKIFEEGPLGMALVGLDNRFVKVNTKLCQITGYEAQELTALTVMDIIPPEEINAHLQRLQRLIRGEMPFIKMEQRTLKKDKEVLWIRLTASLIRGDDGEPLYILEMIEDITEHMRLQGQLLQAQKMEAVGRLAGGIAHDFNNILSVINGYSDLIRGSLGLDDPMRSSVEAISGAGQRAASLTRQLLAFSRKQVLQPQVLDLNTLIADLDKIFRRLLGEDVILATVLDPALKRITADPGQIEQIIMNLVINSRDAMPRGGELTLETANVDLDESYVRTHLGARAGTYVVLRVNDTGCGMDAATKARLFEPFFTTKVQGKGTGLGLATVYGIVKQSAGYITVDSEPGRGTEFKIFLPASDKPVAEKRLAPAAAAAGSETVLLVEDDQALRGLIHEILLRNGYAVLEAANAGEALLICERHTCPIPLMLTDVVMPQMSGCELAERLAPLHPEMKVLFMSGYTEDSIVNHGVLSKGINFIEKPFSPDAVVRKVREVLDDRLAPLPHIPGAFEEYKQRNVTGS